jgi:hypothetical protein
MGGETYIVRSSEDFVERLDPPKKLIARGIHKRNGREYEKVLLIYEDKKVEEYIDKKI